MDIINKLQRNEQLEFEIDRKIYFNCIRPGSMYLYLHILFEMIDKHNNQLDKYACGRIESFIRYRKLEVENLSYNQHRLFSAEELDYISNFNFFIGELKGKLSGGKHNGGDYCSYLLSVCEDSYKSYQGCMEQVKDYIVNEINKLKNSLICIKYDGKNIHIIEPRYKYQIIVVSDSSILTVNNEYCVNALIFFEDIRVYFEKLKLIRKIKSISYINDEKRLVRIYIDCVLTYIEEKVDRLSRQVKSSKYVDEQKVENNFLSFINDLQGFVLSVKSVYSIYNKEKSKQDYIRSLKHIRYKLGNIIGFLNINNYSNHVSELAGLVFTINIAINNENQSHDLDVNIAFALSEIKRNNTLYILSKNNKKNEDYAFGEENLSSIFASNLRCLYMQNDLTIHCEALVGNGRSDIRISRSNTTISIIESKLIRGSSDVQKETLGAIEQLYSRYSENDSINVDQGIQLYLIVFTYDKNFRDIDQSIKSAIEIYSQRNTLEYLPIGSNENTLRFKFIDKRIYNGFLDKERILTIHVCNMEIDYKKMSAQRTKQSSYDPTLSR